MSDNEIEDIQFLPGASARKRGVYEPSAIEKCKQFICTPLKSALIVSVVLVVILLVALIAALARAPTTPCRTDTASQHVTTTPTSTAKPYSSFPWQNLRLPPFVKPLVYHIYLHPDLDKFTFRGQVNMTLSMKETRDFIIFHSKNLTLQSQKLYMSSAGSLQELHIAEILTNTDQQQVYIRSSQPLEQGKNYTVTVDFSGTLDDDLAGFYRSSYKTKSGEERWLATTQFESTNARAAFPCLDEPQLKAHFKLSIVRDDKHITLSNTQIEKTVNLLDDGTSDLVVDHYDMSVKMSTYLVAFVVCDFPSKVVDVADSDRTSNVSVKVYTPPDYIDQARLAAEVAPRILDYYEEYFGIKYPLKKSDHVAVPDFPAGAMENWGLITYRMRNLLVNETTASPSDSQTVVTVIAHELAHQWFGNLVTMLWWNDIWLNEGFASYVEYKGTDHVKPEWKMFDQFLIMATWRAMRLDGLKNSHPITTEVDDPSEIEELFDAISYDKGASIIRMLDFFLGEDTFRAGLTRYLNQYKFSNAKTEDLWRALSQVNESGVDVVKVMKSWTNQMGYPTVIVERNGNKLTMTQKQFLYNPRAKMDEIPDSPYGYKWYIPLTYTTDKMMASSAHKLVWMNLSSVVINMDQDVKWIKFNVQHTGFYRVKYDHTLYSQLITQLKTDHLAINPSDRASLVEDVFALARSGDVPISTAMDLSTYLREETAYVPWDTAVRSLQYICRLMAEKSSYSKLEAYYTKLVEPKLSENIWEEPSEHLEKLQQEVVLANALFLQHEATIQTALDKFRQWMNNGVDIQPSVKSLVYAAGAKFGGRAEYDFLYGQYKNASDIDRKEFLSAMMSTTDAVQLQRLLDLSLNTDVIRSQDTAHVILGIASKPAGQHLAWNFVKRNWETILTRYEGTAFQLQHFIEVPLRSQLTSQYDYDDVKDFFAANLHGKYKRLVSQTLESIEMNIDWLARNQEELEAWLDQKMQS